MAKVKVSIAVSVDKNGDWCSAGWSGTTAEKAREYTLDTLEHGEAHYILEAELEIPESKTIEATIIEKED